MTKHCENCETENDGSYGSGRFCSSKCARGFSTKNKRKEINEKVSIKIKEKLISGERVGFAKIVEKYVKECKECKRSYETLKIDQMYCSTLCMHQSREYRENLSKSTKGKCGGIRKGAGRGKSGWYKGFWCDSSYELAWVIYNLEHDIRFERNKEAYIYEYKGEIHKYYPDFILDGKIIEIKGFSTEQTRAKSESVENLVILYGKDIKKEIDYVISKYGRDFISLYEGNPYDSRTKKCEICGEAAKRKYCSRRCSGLAVSRKKDSQTKTRVLSSDG
jgi:hypothetical protein